MAVLVVCPRQTSDACNWQEFQPWCQNPTCIGSPLNDLLCLLPLVSLSPPEVPSSFPNVPFQWTPSIPQTSCCMLCAVQSAHFHKPHFDTSQCQFLSSLVGQTVKHLPTMWKTTGFSPWVRKISWRRKWQPTPVFLPGKSHGRRSLVGYCPWGRKESDTTGRLHFTSLMSIHCVNYIEFLVCKLTPVLASPLNTNWQHKDKYYVSLYEWQKQDAEKQKSIVWC